MPAHKNKTYFTASLSAEPALKDGTFASGIWMVSLVRGFRPVRAARVFTSKVPKPTRATLSPSASASVMEARTAFTAASASFLESSVFAARQLPVQFCSFTFPPFPIDRIIFVLLRPKGRPAPARKTISSPCRAPLPAALPAHIGKGTCPWLRSRPLHCLRR